eukprot:TRINITY_DN5591_c0_g1_i4.p2 TRINITY_DN5591_c0_g1~~TRINITY_DN5591_c0_g1_i4.p2  ORF type:complete len:111 (+),score=31.29 TRINITY_DN5591_c0_g1_i4:113-445(+)
MAFTQPCFASLLQDNPFMAQATAAPTTVHGFFLDRPCEERVQASARLAALQVSEEFVLQEQVLWLHTPDGFGTSKLARQAMRSIGVEGTARNWRSCVAVRDLNASRCNIE